MSNLSRKVRRNTESNAAFVERMQKRLKEHSKKYEGRRLFPTATEGRIGALNNLSEADRGALSNEMGVVDLDNLKYRLRIVWTPRIGWTPEWTLLGSGAGSRTGRIPA
ncbi:MAG: hypothetical protein QQN63_00015 [Nitrosopumilus sp.]